MDSYVLAWFGGLLSSTVFLAFELKARARRRQRMVLTRNDPHTSIIMKVSHDTYEEIRKTMIAADYQHALNGDVIDMHGIAVQCEQKECNP